MLIMKWLSSLASLNQQRCYYCLVIVQVAVIDAVTTNIDVMEQNSVQMGKYLFYECYHLQKH